MQTSNCRTKLYFVPFFNWHVCLARRLRQSWSLEHTSLEHVALCVSEFLQKSLSLQHNFVDLIVCDLSWQQNSVEETINIQVNLSLQCFTTTWCCCNLSPCSLFEGIRPELQKPLWSTLKLAYFVKIPKASLEPVLMMHVSYYDHCNNMLLSCQFQIVPTTVKSLSGHETKTNQYSVTQRVSQKGSPRYSV